MLTATQIKSSHECETLLMTNFGIMKKIKFQRQFKEKILKGIKKTTIRRDRNRQYLPGVIFEFEEWLNGENKGVFARSKIVSVIQIEIFPFEKSINLRIDYKWHQIENEDLEEFIKNEGFETETDFWKWFDVHFKGFYITWSERLFIPDIHEPKLFKE